MSIIKLESILDKYIIVVDGDESKIVYSVDDSRIFSIHITGSARGARNAVLSKTTFKSLSAAKRGIKHLDTCHYSYKFKAIKVSDLALLSEKGWYFLMEDIDSYNKDVVFEKEIENNSKKEEKERYKKLKKEAITLVKNGCVYSIEHDEVNNVIIHLSYPLTEW